jgi:hypothetical protein
MMYTLAIKIVRLELPFKLSCIIYRFLESDMVMLLVSVFVVLLDMMNADSHNAVMSAAD